MEQVPQNGRPPASNGAPMITCSVYYVLCERSSAPCRRFPGLAGLGCLVTLLPHLEIWGMLGGFPGGSSCRVTMPWKHHHHDLHRALSITGLPWTTHNERAPSPESDERTSNQPASTPEHSLFSSLWAADQPMPATNISVILLWSGLPGYRSTEPASSATEAREQCRAHGMFSTHQTLSILKILGRSSLMPIRPCCDVPTSSLLTLVGLGLGFCKQPLRLEPYV